MMAVNTRDTLELQEESTLDMDPDQLPIRHMALWIDVDQVCMYHVSPLYDMV